MIAELQINDTSNSSTTLLFWKQANLWTLIYFVRH
jgi:hypothetical protein